MYMYRRLGETEVKREVPQPGNPFVPRVMCVRARRGEAARVPAPVEAKSGQK